MPLLRGEAIGPGAADYRSALSFRGRGFFVFFAGKIPNMFTDEFKHDLRTVLDTQSAALLAKQNAIAATSLRKRSGRLAASLQERPVIGGRGVTMSYPKYIRFLDMRYGQGGRRKKKVPIYSRQVYGYLVGGVRRWLNRVIPDFMIRAIDGAISGRKV